MYDVVARLYYVCWAHIGKWFYDVTLVLTFICHHILFWRLASSGNVQMRLNLKTVYLLADIEQLDIIKHE